MRLSPKQTMKPACSANFLVDFARCFQPFFRVFRRQDAAISMSPVGPTCGDGIFDLRKHLPSSLFPRGRSFTAFFLGNSSPLHCFGCFVYTFGTGVIYVSIFNIDIPWQYVHSINDTYFNIDQHEPKIQLRCRTQKGPAAGAA